MIASTLGKFTELVLDVEKRQLPITVLTGAKNCYIDRGWIRPVYNVQTYLDLTAFAFTDTSSLFVFYDPVSAKKIHIWKGYVTDWRMYSRLGGVGTYTFPGVQNPFPTDYILYKGAVYFTSTGGNFKIWVTTAPAITYQKWGIDPPTQCGINTTGAGSLAAGTYYYKYTFANESSPSLVESNGSAAASQAVGAAASITINVTNTGSDGQATHKYIYRSTTGASSSYFYLGKVAIGTLTYADTGAVAPNTVLPIPQTNNIPFYGGYAVGLYKNRLFVAVGGVIYFSKALLPEYFPAENTRTVGEPNVRIVKMIEYLGTFYIIKQDGIWAMSGEDETEFRLTKVFSEGAVNPDACKLIKNSLYFVNNTGFKKWSFAGPVINLSEKMQTVIEELRINNYTQRTFVFYEPRSNKVMFGVPETGFIYIIDPDQNTVVGTMKDDDFYRSGHYYAEEPGKECGQFLRNTKIEDNFTDSATKQLDLAFQTGGVIAEPIYKGKLVRLLDIFYQYISTNAETLTVEMILGNKPATASIGTISFNVLKNPKFKVGRTDQSTSFRFSGTITKPFFLMGFDVEYEEIGIW